jgi:microcystin-dependent protein
MADLHKNFAYSTVLTAPSPALSGVSLVVQSGQGALYPTPPFNATVWPAGAIPTTSNAEIVRVTAISTDTLTITRAQESSNARTILVGDQISANITKKSFDDIEAYLNPTGTINPYAGRAVPTNWLSCDGSAVSRTTYAALMAVIMPTVGTFTITIAAPAVVSQTAHGFITGDQVYFTTTGALPTGLSINTIYYVVKIDANSYNLATTYANAVAGTKITTTGSQSGTHTAVACPFGLGDGSTTFNVPDLRGRVPAGTDAMFGAAAASRLTAPTNTANTVAGTLGASGGLQVHTLVTAELASHTHGINSVGTTGSGFTGHTFAVASNQGVQNTVASGSDTNHNNTQPTLVVNYIIKT